MHEGSSNKNRELSRVVIGLKVFAELMMKIFETELGEVKEEKT
jgi:hypothetical protein